MKSLLTIIVPVYNRAELIETTLDGIAASRRELALKLILVDNNSTDNTLAVCTAWAARHRSPLFDISVIEEKQPGAPAARNAGLNQADTPYVYFFDSDDLFSSDFLTDIKTFLARPTADTPDLLFVPVIMRRGKQVQTRNYISSGDPSVQIITSMLSTQSMIFRTAWLRKIGGWEVSLSIWQDWELGVRALLHHPSILWATTKSYHEVQVHDNSITGASASSRWPLALEAMHVVLEEITSTNRFRQSELHHCLQALYLRAFIHAGRLSGEGCREGARAFAALARQALPSPTLFLRLLGPALQRYTSAGGRGAWRLALFCNQKEKLLHRSVTLTDVD